MLLLKFNLKKQKKNDRFKPLFYVPITNSKFIYCVRDTETISNAYDPQNTDSNKSRVKLSKP